MEKSFTHVGCYVRVSTENQLENYSIGEQTERLGAYCKAKGWHIYKFYPDPGFSGGNMNRPALQQMLQDVHAGLLDMIIVYKLDRLSRSQKDTLTLIEDEFLINNVEFTSMSENFDTSAPLGRAMIGILSVFAQLEKDQITERFTMGRIGRCKAGYFHGGGNAPTGYNYVNGKLVVDDYKAEQVRLAYQMFLAGSNVNAICNTLHEKFGSWNNSTSVYNVLHNSLYIGKVKFKGKEFDGVHTPIISKEDFEQVQQLFHSSKRAKKKNGYTKTPFRANYLLSSLIYCKHCGARYSANHGYYKCYSRSKSEKKYIVDPNCKNKNYEISELDKLVIDEIHRIKYDKEYFDKVLGQRPTNQKANEHKAIQSSLNDIKIQIARLLDLYQVGSLPIEEISDRMDKLQTRKNYFEKELASSQSEIDAPLKMFMGALASMDTVLLKKGTLEEKRLLISTLIKSIWIDEDTINIKWRI